MTTHVPDGQKVHNKYVDVRWHDAMVANSGRGCIPSWDPNFWASEARDEGPGSTIQQCMGCSRTPEAIEIGYGNHLQVREGILVWYAGHLEHVGGR